MKILFAVFLLIILTSSIMANAKLKGRFEKKNKDVYCGAFGNLIGRTNYTGLPHHIMGNIAHYLGTDIKKKYVNSTCYSHKGSLNQYYNGTLYSDSSCFVSYIIQKSSFDHFADIFSHSPNVDGINTASCFQKFFSTIGKLKGYSKFWSAVKDVRDLRQGDVIAWSHDHTNNKTLKEKEDGHVMFVINGPHSDIAVYASNGTSCPLSSHKFLPFNNENNNPTYVDSENEAIITSNHASHPKDAISSSLYIGIPVNVKSGHPTDADLLHIKKPTTTPATNSHIQVSSIAQHESINSKHLGISHIQASSNSKQQGNPITQETNAHITHTSIPHTDASIHITQTTSHTTHDGSNSKHGNANPKHTDEQAKHISSTSQTSSHPVEINPILTTPLSGQSSHPVQTSSQTPHISSPHTQENEHPSQTNSKTKLTSNNHIQESSYPVQTSSQTTNTSNLPDQLSSPSSDVSSHLPQTSHTGTPPSLNSQPPPHESNHSSAQNSHTAPNRYSSNIPEVQSEINNSNSNINNSANNMNSNSANNSNNSSKDSSNMASGNSNNSSSNFDNTSNDSNKDNSDNSNSSSENRNNSINSHNKHGHDANSCKSPNTGNISNSCIDQSTPISKVFPDSAPAFYFYVYVADSSDTEHYNNNGPRITKGVHCRHKNGTTTDPTLTPSSNSTLVDKDPKQGLYNRHHHTGVGSGQIIIAADANGKPIGFQMGCKHPLIKAEINMGRAVNKK